jgi:hypothetical protein
MLPLATSELPASPDDLCTSIKEGFARYKIGPRRIAASGECATLLESLTIDLTDSTFDRELRLPKKAGQSGGSKIAVKTFELLGEPLFFERTAVDLNLRATDVVFALASSSGESLLAPESVAEGEVTISVTRQALEGALQELASGAARKQGVEIKKTRLALTSKTARSLSFRADVTAKMFIMSASVVLTGEVEIDDELTACVSKLHFSGSGMAASAAGAFIQPHLKKYDGTKFPLMAFSLGAAKLREIEVSGGEALRLHARFS